MNEVALSRAKGGGLYAPVAARQSSGAKWSPSDDLNSDGSARNVASSGLGGVEPGDEIVIHCSPAPLLGGVVGGRVVQEQQQPVRQCGWRGGLSRRWRRPAGVVPLRRIPL